jgi:phosphohistidine swiveling domain-containing protein
VWDELARSHPEIRRRLETSATVFKRKLWREDLERWDREVKPAAIRTHLALLEVDPDTLDTTGLLEYLDRCRENQIQGAYMRSCGPSSSPATPLGRRVGRACALPAGGRYADAPPFLGGEPGDPLPDEWLPPAAARLERAIGVAVQAIFAATEPPTEGRIGARPRVRPGVYEGTARVIRGTEEFGRIEPGDVLVTNSTTTAFNIALPLLGAIVTDRGGLLSHAAIVAREYGLPAVVGCTDATSVLPDGGRVVVDGTGGGSRSRRMTEAAAAIERVRPDLRPPVTPARAAALQEACAAAAAIYLALELGVVARATKAPADPADVAADCGLMQESARGAPVRARRYRPPGARRRRLLSARTSRARRRRRPLPGALPSRHASPAAGSRPSSCKLLGEHAHRCSASRTRGSVRVRRGKRLRRRLGRPRKLRPRPRRKPVPPLRRGGEAPARATPRGALRAAAGSQSSTSSG